MITTQSADRVVPPSSTISNAAESRPLRDGKPSIFFRSGLIAKDDSIVLVEQNRDHVRFEVLANLDRVDEQQAHSTTFSVDGAYSAILPLHFSGMASIDIAMLNAGGNATVLIDPDSTKQSHHTLESLIRLPHFLARVEGVAPQRDTLVVVSRNRPEAALYRSTPEGPRSRVASFEWRKGRYGGGCDSMRTIRDTDSSVSYLVAKAFGLPYFAALELDEDLNITRTRTITRAEAPHLSQGGARFGSSLGRSCVFLSHLISPVHTDDTWQPFGSHGPRIYFTGIDAESVDFVESATLDGVTVAVAVRNRFSDMRIFEIVTGRVSHVTSTALPDMVISASTGFASETNSPVIVLVDSRTRVWRLTKDEDGQWGMPTIIWKKK